MPTIKERLAQIITDTLPGVSKCLPEDLKSNKGPKIKSDIASFYGYAYNKDGFKYIGFFSYSTMTEIVKNGSVRWLSSFPNTIMDEIS